MRGTYTHVCVSYQLVLREIISLAKPTAWDAVAHLVVAVVFVGWRKIGFALRFGTGAGASPARRSFVSADIFEPDN